MMSSQKASGTSKANIGIHKYETTGPLTNPASCKGRPTTRRTEATTPIHANEIGIVRPRRKRYEKSVLPMANKIAGMLEWGR